MRKKLIAILLPLAVLFACIGFAACENDVLPEKLAAPQDLKIRGELLTWKEVDRADGYCVYIEDREYVAEGCSYDLGELNQNKKYTVEVMAYSDAGIAHSEGSFIRYVGKDYATEGMVFQSFNDNSARVKQLAVEEDGLCAIPASWNGYTVTGFSQLDRSSDTELCSKIKSLYLPSSIQGISSSLTASFSNLKNLVLRGEHEKFVTEDNCLIDKETNTLVIGCIGSVIPEYVTAIGKYAFQNRNVKSFTFPDNVTRIDSHAFYGCKQLEEIRLPERLEQSNFASVFNGCSSLKKAEVPNGVKNLMKAFVDCTSLTEVKIPEGVVNLTGTFINCTSLKEVTLPDSAETLWGTFAGCSSLQGVRIPEGVTMLKQTFVDCTSLKAFTVPKHVKELRGAFGGCTSLQSVAFEEGVEVLNTSLSSSYARGISSFEGCVALTEVKLPQSLTAIGYSVFMDCIKLESISIPENVTQIGRCAFQNCFSLKSVALPGKLTTIETGAFGNCVSLTEIELPESLTTLGGAFEGCTGLRTVRIPNSITDIKAALFGDCSSLQSVTFSENTSVISVRAFGNCTALQSVDICSTEVNITGNAFEGCTALKSVVLPKRTKVQNYAFTGCPLEAVYYRGSEAEWEENAINIVKQYNSELLSATRYYYSETAPALNEEGTAYAGNFWRYENGVPTVWVYEA